MRVHTLYLRNMFPCRGPRQGSRRRSRIFVSASKSICRDSRRLFAEVCRDLQRFAETHRFAVFVETEFLNAEICRDNVCRFAEICRDLRRLNFPCKLTSTYRGELRRRRVRAKSYQRYRALYSPETELLTCPVCIHSAFCISYFVFPSMSAKTNVRALPSFAGASSRR